MQGKRRELFTLVIVAGIGAAGTVSLVASLCGDLALASPGIEAIAALSAFVLVGLLAAAFTPEGSQRGL